MRNDYLYDKIDNCLLCKDADIHKNEVAELFRKLGFAKIADNVNSMFPVVICKKDNRYVANPMKRPGWCKRESH